MADAVGVVTMLLNSAFVGHRQSDTSGKKADVRVLSVDAAVNQRYPYACTARNAEVNLSLHVSTLERNLGLTKKSYTAPLLYIKVLFDTNLNGCVEFSGELLAYLSCDCGGYAWT